MEFFHGDSSVHLDTISSSGAITTFTVPTDSTFNKVVLTFSGDAQNFREIEIFGIPTPTVVDSVSIVGFDTVLVGGRDTLRATVIGINAEQTTVKWSSSDEAVATVDSTGLVTGVGAGTAGIIATSTVDSTQSDTLEITVPTPTITGVSITGDYSVWVGYTAPFSATVTGTNISQTVKWISQAVKWSSSDENVATVDSITGVVRGIDTGTVTITATSALDNTQSASKTIAIIAVQTNNIAPDAEIDLTATRFYHGNTKENSIANIIDGVKNTDAHEELIVGSLGGSTLTFDWSNKFYHYGRFVYYNRKGYATHRIVGSTVEFFHGDASVHLDTITSSGAITTILPDSTVEFNKVIVTFSGGPKNFREIEIYGTLAPPTVDSVTIAGEDTVFVGDTLPLTARVFGTNEPSQSVTWSSSNEDIAPVDSITGVVRGIDTGTVTITVTSNLDTRQTATQQITIPAPTVDSVSITGKDIVLLRETTSLMAEVFGTYIVQTVKWSSSNPAVATVSSTGVVTSVAPGTASIIATFAVDTTKADTLEITVPSPDIDSVSIAGSDSISLKGTTSLTATVHGMNVSQAVKWTSDSTAVATVSSTGVVTGVALGTASIIATSTVDSTKADTVEITVIFPDIDSITISGDGSIWVGDSSPLSATVFGTYIVQTVTWNTGNADVATVDSITGVVTAKSAGTVTIIATSSVDESKFATKTIAIVEAQTNLSPSADVTTTVTNFYNGNASTNIARLRDGVTNSDDASTALVHPTDANGKNFTFAWPGKLYHTGRFVFYNRIGCCGNRIDESTVEFFNGDSSIYLDTILNAGDTVTIVPDFTVEFNKVVLTFSGGAQNFREIEVYGTPTASTVTGVSIAGDRFIWLGDSASYSARVTGVNVPQTVEWSSSDEAVATVSDSGVVRGLSAGTVTITATSTFDNTKIATKTIVINPEPINVAPRAEITTTVTDFYTSPSRGATGDSAANVLLLTDGVKNSDNLGKLFLAEPNANGKTLTFAWPREFFHTGRFVFYNRGSYRDRIDGSTVEFFNGDSSVYLDTILNAGDTVTITTPLDLIFNKVVLTFSGDAQNFREIEIFGNSTLATVVDSVSIAGEDTVFVGDTISLTATVAGINVNQTVTWSSSDINIVTVDSASGKVVGVFEGTATITATSTQDTNQFATKEITVPSPTVDSVSITGDYSIWVGQTALFSATVFVTNGASQTVTWSSSNDGIAFVDSLTGVVRGVSTGIVTIIATSVADNLQTARKTISIIPVQTNNIAPRATATTTVTHVWDGFNSGNPVRVQKQLRRVTDGRKNSDNDAHLMIPNQNANGKTITFAWPSGLFTHGRFAFYNRQNAPYHERIVGSTVAFFHGDSRVHLDTISSSGAIITILPDSTVEFNKVVLTFSGNTQNFREIEIFGIPTPTVVDSVSIVGKDTVLKGGTDTLSASVFGVNAAQTRVTWSSGDTTVATVDSTGVVTGISAGTATITVTSKFDNSQTATKTITVPIPIVNSVTIAGKDTVLVESTISLTATVTGTHASQSVKWSSDSIHIATVDPSTGVVTGVASGTAIIIATSVVDTTQADSLEITVPPPSIEGVSIVTGPDSVWVTRTIALRATVLGTNVSQVVTWSSRNTNVATVDSTGIVTGVSGGTAEIIATSKADTTQADTLEITVPAPIVNAVSVIGDEFIWVGSTTTLRSTVFGTHTVQAVTWSSSDESVATVDSTGVVTGKTTGTVTITATSIVDNSRTASKTIVIILEPTNIIPVAEITTTVEVFHTGNPANNIARLRDGVTNSDDLNTALVHPKNAHGENFTFAWPSGLYHAGRFVFYNRSSNRDRIDGSTVEFFNGDSSVHLDTISNAGATVTIVPDFTVEFNKIVLTFPSSGDGSQNFIEIEVYGTATPSIYDSVSIQGADTVFVGDIIPLTATVHGTNVDQTVTWSSDNEGVATVDSASGRVMGVSAGTVNIIATSTEDSTQADTVSITVSMLSVTSVSIAGGDNFIWVGHNDTLSVTVLGTAPKTVKWTSSNTAVAIVSPTGVVTGKTAGTVTITATSTVDNSKMDTKTISIFVEPTNITPDAEITTTVTNVYGSGTVQEHISRIRDGITTSDAADSIADLTSANGKTLTFTWPSKLFHTGHFVFYNRTSNRDRIDSSTVEFFYGDSSVYLDTILNAGDTVTIVSDFAARFNKIVLTFSGDAQNIREIEILGTPTASTVDSISIAGEDTVLVGDTLLLTVMVSVTNGASESVIWTSHNPEIATVDSITGQVVGVSGGVAEIVATSTQDTNQFATKTITVPSSTVDSVSIVGDGSIWVGSTTPFSATVFGTNIIQTVQWSSSDEAVATVDSITGVVTGKTAGTVTITATSIADNSQTASKTIVIILEPTNIVSSASITTTVTDFLNGNTPTNIARLRNGVKNSDDETTHLIQPRDADGKTLTFAWPGKRFNIGRFVFYNRASHHNRIDGSTVQFFNGDSRVHTATISNAGDTVTIVPDFTARFNKIVLTFSGDEQNFREIEIFGTPTASTVDSISIAGEDTLFVGDTLSLTAMVSVTNGASQTVTWSSSNTNVATVDSSSGKVVGVGIGEVTITATSTVDNLQTASKEITVPTPRVDSVSITGDYSVWVGYTAHFSATVSVTNGASQTVTWSSSNDGIASVDSDGEVRGVSTGTVTITATSIADNSQTASKTIAIIAVQTNNIAPDAEITTTVTDFYGSRDSATHISVLTDGVRTSDASDSIAGLFNADGKTITFAWPRGLFHTGRIIFYNRQGDSYHERIVGSTVAFFHGVDRVYLDTIHRSGAITTILPDSTVEFNKVILTFSENEQNFREIEVYGTPTPATVDSVSIAGSDTVLVRGRDTLRATVIGINAPQTVTWSSSNESVATVSDSGVVRGIFAGTATITATSTVDNLQTATKEITVPTPAVDSVSISGKDTVLLRETTSFTAEVFGTYIVQTVKWSSSNESVATVDSTGMVTGVAGGTAEIIATSVVDTTQADSLEITIPSPTVDGVSITTGPDSVWVGSPITLRATVLGTNVSQSVTWSTSNANVVLVDSSTGVVRGVSAGTAEIIATSKADPTQADRKEITVMSIDSILITGDGSIWVGDSRRFSAAVFATNGDSETVKWSSSEEGIATVDSTTGEVRAVSAGKVTITATSTVDATQTARKTIAIVEAQTNLSPSADVTTTVTSFYTGSASTNIARLRDGVTYSNDVNTALVHPTNAQGKTLTFAWPSNLYNTGRFVFYNRSSHRDRIDGSTVEFFNGDSSVHLDTILNAGDKVTIVLDFTVEFNKIVLTFRTSGDGSQNFREIEIFGTPVPATVNSVSIVTSADSVLIGDTIPLTATVSGINEPAQTVTWSSDSTEIATVNDSGVVRGVSAGMVNIIATSTVDSTVSDTVTITVMSVNSVTIAGEDSVLQGSTIPLTATVSATHAPETVTWTSSNEAVATVSSTGEVRGVGGGTVDIIATSTVDVTKADTVSITVPTPAVDSVTIAGDDSVFVKGTITLTAAVFARNGADSTVTWSSSDVNVAIVDSTGVVTGVSAGTATITVTSKFDSSQIASQTITVPTPAVDSVTIAGMDSVFVKGTIALTATVFARNGADSTVTWSSSDVNVAIVDSTGVVTGVSAGTATITVTSKFDASQTASKEIRIPTFVIDSVTIAGNDSVFVAGTTLLTATVFGTNAAQAVIWSSNDLNVATVDSNGEVTGVAVGTAKIIATSTADNSKADTLEITVPTPTIDSVTITGMDTVLKGDTISLTATVFGTNVAQAVTWSSSNEGVATVNPSTGEVTAIDTGMVNIIATSTVDGTQTATVTITVMSVNSVTITGDTSVLKGFTLSLTVTVSVTNGASDSVTWSSSDEDVATVNPSTGEVTAIDTGMVNIIATSTVDSTQADTVAITVMSVNSVTIAGETSVLMGDTIGLTATVSVTNGAVQTVTWTSSDTGVARVDSDGRVVGVSAGVVNIIATSTVDSTQADTVAIAVTAPLATVESISITGENSVFVEDTISLMATVSVTNGAPQTVTWNTSNEDVARVDSNGRVVGVSVGTVTITATSTFDPTKTATITISIIVPPTNLAPSADIPPTVTEFYTNPQSGATGDSAANVLVLTDGVKNSDDLDKLFLAEPNANGKTITFTWSGKLYTHGKFVLYDRVDCCSDRIDSSTVGILPWSGQGVYGHNFRCRGHGNHCP